MGYKIGLMLGLRNILGRPSVGCLSLVLAALLWAAPPPAEAQPQSEVDADLQALLEGGRWLDFNTGIRRNLQVRSVTVDPTRETRLYAGGEGFIYRSLDGGDRWDVVYSVFRRSTGGVTEEMASNIEPEDIEDLSDEDVQRIEDRFRELRDQLFDEVAAEQDEVTAAEVVEAAEDELLEQALEEVLSEADAGLQEEDVIFFSAAPIPETRVSQLVVDTDNPAIVYAATGRGLFRSPDHGHDWERIYRGVGDAERRVRAVAETGPAVVAATEGGILRSGGDESPWGRVSGPPADVRVRFLARAPSRPSRLYAIADGRIYRSDDSGESWLPMTVPAGLGPDDFANLAVDPGDADRLYVATVDGVLRSDNGGRLLSWAGTLGLRERRTLWVEVVGGIVLLGTVDGFYYSLDGGDRWQENDAGLSASVIHQIAVAPSGHVWLATDRGLFQLLRPQELIPDPAAARRAAELFAQEPTMGQTVMAALTYYGYIDLPVASWVQRVRWSRFAPVARVRWQMLDLRREARDYIPGPQGEGLLEDFNVRRDDDEDLQILLTWDVDDLVYDNREFSVRQLADRLVGRRNRLVRRVVRDYQTRRELMLRMTTTRRRTVSRQVRDRLELEELTARLDLATGGFFSAFAALGEP